MLFLCVIAATREPEERGVAILAVVTNAVAFLTSMAAVVNT